MSSFHVLTAEFLHETNTFCKLPTTIETFKERQLLFGADAIAARRTNNTEIAGFLDAAEVYNWQVAHVLSAHAQPGGPVTKKCFDEIANAIVDAAAVQQQKGQLDGILLGLHGAMVPDFCDDGEGELLQRLRDQVGPSVPIAITLDPHANVSCAMCNLADIIVSYKTYPHIDMQVTARLAADILQRTMLREIQPVTLRVTRPMLEEANAGRTDIGPMIQRFEQVAEYEQAETDVFAVSINGAFPNADIVEVGASVLVTLEKEGEGTKRHIAFATMLADDIWKKRYDCLNQYHTVQQAASLCKSYRGSKPIVVADYADNPGAGCYGDATALLAALLEVRVENACFGPIVDAETVTLLMQHQPGDPVSISLGGKTDSRFGGAPLDVSCTLVSLHGTGDYVGSGEMIGGLRRTWGPTAVIKVDNVEVLVVSIRAQILDLEQFRTFGINPLTKTVVGVKSMQHFRAAFEPISGQVIVCDSGAMGTLDYAVLPFARVTRPVFPLDKDIDIDAWLDSNNQGVYIPQTLQR